MIIFDFMQHPVLIFMLIVLIIQLIYYTRLAWKENKGLYLNLGLKMLPVFLIIVVVVYDILNMQEVRDLPIGEAMRGFIGLLFFLNIMLLLIIIPSLVLLLSKKIKEKRI